MRRHKGRHSSKFLWKGSSPTRLFEDRHDVLLIDSYAYLFLSGILALDQTAYPVDEESVCGSSSQPKAGISWRIPPLSSLPRPPSRILPLSTLINVSRKQTQHTNSYINSASRIPPVWSQTQLPDPRRSLKAMAPHLQRPWVGLCHSLLQCHIAR